MSFLNTFSMHSWMTSVGNADGLGRPPANEIIPGICVTLSNSLISEALNVFALFENKRSIFTTTVIPQTGEYKWFYKDMHLY